MAILITGAAGQFGRRTTELLMQRVDPAELILTTRNPDRLAAAAAKGAVVRYADFDDAASLGPAFVGADKMLLISTARVGGRVVQHQRAVDAARAAGVGHIVYTSSVGISPDNPAIVIADHMRTENLIRASGAAWTFLRDSQYAEALATAIAPRAAATGQWVASAEDGKVGFVSRDDCCACAAAVLSTAGHENKVYTLTGPELLSFRQAAALAAEVAGRRIDYVRVTDEDMMVMFDSLGVPRKPVDDQVIADIPWCSEDMVTYEQSIREGWFDVLTDDVKTLTGHAPRSLRQVFEAHRDVIAGRA
jgi:NAD(P)H dehydrogenase (quinone)